MARHNEIGEIGENISANWLKKKGFSVIERNYLKKWGEIDIVARETNGNTHFIEVKTVSYETRQILNYAVSHETWRPEENVHRNKQMRFKKAIQSWIIDNKYDGEWCIDVITVRIVPHEKYACIKFFKNVIFE